MKFYSEDLRLIRICILEKLLSPYLSADKEKLVKLKDDIEIYLGLKARKQYRTNKGEKVKWQDKNEQNLNL